MTYFNILIDYLYSEQLLQTVPTQIHYPNKHLYIQNFK